MDGSDAVVDPDCSFVFLKTLNMKGEEFMSLKTMRISLKKFGEEFNKSQQKCVHPILM